MNYNDLKTYVRSCDIRDIRSAVNEIIDELENLDKRLNQQQIKVVTPKGKSRKEKDG